MNAGNEVQLHYSIQLAEGNTLLFYRSFGKTRTRITFCSVNFHLLCQSLTFLSCSRSSSNGVRSIKVLNVLICKVIPADPGSYVEWTSLHCVRHRNVRWVQGSRQSLVASLNCFFQSSVVQVLVGLWKQFINNFVFPTWACAACFNINNNYYYVAYSLASNDMLLMRGNINRILAT